VRLDRAALTRAQVALVAVSTVLQLGARALAGDALAAGTTARHVFSTIEMALVVALVVVAVGIARWADDQVPLAATVARLTLASIVLCTVGDLINRNYPEHAFQWDDVVEHSYLITSIVASWPGSRRPTTLPSRRGPTSPWRSTRSCSPRSPAAAFGSGAPTAGGRAPSWWPAASSRCSPTG
jgi:hypothetical protein